MKGMSLMYFQLYIAPNESHVCGNLSDFVLAY